jgi:murein DD-endopeptidase MepM/ murein hydrolase activator NlpD
MSTTRAKRRVPAAFASTILIAVAVGALGHRAGSEANGPSVTRNHDLTVDPGRGNEAADKTAGALEAGVARPAADVPSSLAAVGGAASALAPARRQRIAASQPIFPMQTTPKCTILDNFGDPRSGGRTHQGTDIMGSLGQEVYAVVDGTLGFQVINGEPGSELSGNAWRLTAAGSTTFYVYMHLSAFADGLQNGSVVTQGQLIGYVGDTGNPGPGNYHLHFEVHPDGGAAINALTVIPHPSECPII